MEELDIIAWRAFAINQVIFQDSWKLCSPFHVHVFDLIGTNKIDSPVMPNGDNIVSTVAYETKAFDYKCKDEFHQLSYKSHTSNGPYGVRHLIHQGVIAPKCKCYKVYLTTTPSTTGFFCMHTLGMVADYIEGFYLESTIKGRKIQMSDIPRNHRPRTGMGSARNFRTTRSTENIVYAPCLLHGIVVEHEKGFRSEKLDILGLYSFHNHANRRVWSHRLGYDIRSIWEAPKLPTYRKGSS